MHFLKHTKYVVFKLKKAQHIVELALIAPFIMFFIGIAYQLTVIIQTHYKFNASLYEAVSFMASKNKIVKETELGLTEEQLKQKTVNNIRQYAQILLNERRAGGNSLNIKLLNTGDIDFLIGTYKFTSTFSLLQNMANPNPESFNYLSIIPVNSAVLKKNSFEIQNEFFDNEYELVPQNILSEDEEEKPETDDDVPSDDTESETDTTDEETSTLDTGSMDTLEAHF